MSGAVWLTHAWQGPGERAMAFLSVDVSRRRSFSTGAVSSAVSLSSFLTPSCRLVFHDSSEGTRKVHTAQGSRTSTTASSPSSSATRSTRLRELNFSSRMASFKCAKKASSWRCHRQRLSQSPRSCNAEPESLERGVAPDAPAGADSEPPRRSCRQLRCRGGTPLWLRGCCRRAPLAPAGPPSPPPAPSSGDAPPAGGGRDAGVSTRVIGVGGTEGVEAPGSRRFGVTHLLQERRVRLQLLGVLATSYVALLGRRQHALGVPPHRTGGARADTTLRPTRQPPGSHPPGGAPLRLRALQQPAA